MLEIIIEFLLSAIALALGGLLIMAATFVKKHDAFYGKLGDLIGWVVIGAAVVLALMTFAQVA